MTASISAALFVAVAALLNLHPASCLFEDQIGLFDWHQSFIGATTLATFDSLKRNLVITSEQNAVAGLNLKNGDILWRQLLEDPAAGHKVHLLAVNGHHVVTVSGDGTVFYIRGWHPVTGILAYEWTLTTDRAAGRWYIQDERLLHIVPVAGSHLEVTEYHTSTGKNRGATTKLSTPWLSDADKCVMAQSYWSCLSSDMKVYYIDLLAEESRVYHSGVPNLLGEATGTVSLSTISTGKPTFLITRNAATRLVTISENNVLQVSPYGHDTTNVIYMENTDASLPESTIQMSAGGTFRSTDMKSGTTTEVPTLYADARLIVAACRGAACRILIANVDESLSLLQLPPGKTLWTREEALSNALAVHYVDLPVSAMDAEIASAFAVDTGDVVSMFLRRITSQINQLSALFNTESNNGQSALCRDDFGLHKLIVIATRVGKLFALDSLTGEIVWQHYLPGLLPFKRFTESKFFLYELRPAKYAHLQPIVVLVARSASGNSNHAVLVKFNPITGALLDSPQHLPFALKQVMALPYSDQYHQKGLLLLAEDDSVHCYPPSVAKELAENIRTTFLYSTDAAKTTLTGYTLSYSEYDTERGKFALRATPTWTFRAMPRDATAGSEAASIVEIVVRPINERVHSQGRVLADRSVFYKYVNPNLLAVAVQAADPVHRSVLSVYLIDAVTGLVLHGVHHKRMRGPVTMIHSENWIVYTYYNERFRRYEVTTLELYEGARQSNGTTFSSHALSQLPHVESSAYIISATPVHMAVTLTERGITNKNVLFALSSGVVLEMPWAFLEPRMQIGYEEGTFAPPYMPELPLPTEAIINYNRTVARIRGVAVSPARLESTSLVLVHGLDLFYTRVAPSKTFDVLKEDFDHWLIVMVLVGLTVASYATKKLAKRKMIKQAWK